MEEKYTKNDVAVAQYSISNITVEVYDKKHIPNRFIRFMQKHILGITWEIFNENNI